LDSPSQIENTMLVEDFRIQMEILQLAF